MTIADKLRSIIVSWDFLGAAALTVAFAIVVPSRISFEVANEIFSIAVSVLAIMFSVFFAAIAVIITAGDNQFVSFLETEGMYTHIVWTFKFTLILLFSALVLSIVLLVVTLPYSDHKTYPYPQWHFPEAYMLAFGFLGVWALFSSAQASLDAIKYAQFRTRFIRVMDLDNKDD